MPVNIHSRKESLVQISTDPTTSVSVVGNSGSVLELSKSDYDKINNSRLIRCNWAFKDPSPIKKEYTNYFSQAYPAEESKNPGQGSIQEELDFECEMQNVHIYDSVTYVLYDNCPGTALMNPKGSPVYSTTGGQMLMYASFMLRPTELNIAGIDMYTHNRPKLGNDTTRIRKYLADVGKPYSGQKNTSIGLSMFKPNLTYILPEQWRELLHEKRHTVHSLESDVLLLLRSFAQLCLIGTKTNFMKTPHLERV